MSNIQFTPDLFLETQELNRFQEFLNGKGSAKDFFTFLTYSPGIIQSKKDISLSSFKIEAGTNPKTIKLADSFAIDENANLIFKEAQDNIIIPDDGANYWIKIAHKFSTIEKGTVSIDAQGNLIGLNTEFTKILRGGEYPIRIKFYNSTGNFDSYEVVSVTNNATAVLVGQFIPETNLRFSVVGYFTDGVIANPSTSEIYLKDSCIAFNTLEAGLVREITNNTPPTKIEGLEFYIARVSILDGSIIIEDKRTEFWKTKSDFNNSNITKTQNPLVGVESIKWDIASSAKNKNELTIGWGIRTKNWTIDSSLRKLTILDGIGGIFKNSSYFTNGDFNGWRVYDKQGNYKTILNSVKAGSQINLTLDSLNPTDYGITSIDEVVVVPSVEEIEFRAIPNSIDNIDIFEQCIINKLFPISNGVGKLYLKHPLSAGNYDYKIDYRYKNNQTYGEWLTLPDNIIGYYKEISFETNGSLKEQSTDRKLNPYQNGIITILANPNNLLTTFNKIYKNDNIGILSITDEFTESFYNLEVGNSKNYIYIHGALGLTNNITFNLSKINAAEGSNFSIHLNCTELNLNNKTISIIQDIDNDNITLKEIKIKDVWCMLNQHKGIKFDFKFDGQNWITSQNYNYGAPFEIKQIDGIIDNLFNSNGLGKVSGLFGYIICDGLVENFTEEGLNIPIPNLNDRFLVGQSDNKAVGSSGGSLSSGRTFTLLEKHLPVIALNTQTVRHGTADNNTGNYLVNSAGGSVTTQEKFKFGGKDNGDGGRETEAITIDVVPPYYSIIFCKKLY